MVEITRTTTDPQEARAFVLSAVALSTAVFGVTFWYGVFGTVFFEHLFNVWLASTVALVASLFVPPAPDLPRFIHWRGRFVLALPSLWLVWEALAGRESGPADTFAWMLGIAVVAITLPYLLYVLILVVVPDVEQLRSARLKLAVVAITAGAALAGYTIGTHHPRFLTCYDFKVSGSDVPENCAAGAD